MLLKKSKLLSGIMACALSLGLLAPPASAAGRDTISEGHTDAFYVDTSDGTPKVLVNHGLSNTKHDPNEIAFAISASTYGEYEVFAPYLERGHSGYYTASEDSDYFEPGWSAPQFRTNGFTSVRIDFTKVEGPGDVAVLGNRLIESEPFAKFLLPTEQIDTLGALFEALASPDKLNQFGTEGIPNGSYYLKAGTSLPIFGHTHAHWFFNAPGHYELTGKAVATRQDGETVESEPFTSVFEVEDAGASGPGAPPSTDGEEADASETDASEATPAPQGNEGQSGYTLKSDPITFDSGHMDAFFIGTRGGSPSLFLKEDVSAAEPTRRVPSSVTMVFVKERYEETGNYNGSIHETAGYHSNAIGPEMSIYSPGWSVDDYQANGFSKAQVRFTSVEGPGKIVLTGTPTLEGSLPPVLRDSSPYLSAGAVLPVTGHTHGYWLFTRPGTYTIKAQALVTPANGGASLESPIETYTFIVEKNPADPSVSEHEKPSLLISNTGGKVEAGSSLEALASGFPEGTRLEAALTAMSAPNTRTALASDATADKTGKATLSLPIPAQLEPGMYTLSVGRPGEEHEAFALVTITARPSSPQQPDPEAPTPPQQPGNPLLPTPEEGPSPDGIITTKDKVEIDHGHLDLLTAIVKDHALYLVVKDDSTGRPILRDPADVTLRVRGNALRNFDKQIAPGLPEQGYLLDAGGLNQQEILFPGWDTNGVRPDYGEVDFEIVSMSAPEGAKAYMFNTKTFGGAEPAFTNGELEITPGAIIHQSRPAHVHTNWLFSAPGEYTMTVRATASPLLAIGSGPLKSRTATYTWKVDEAEAAPAPPTTSPSPAPAQDTREHSSSPSPSQASAPGTTSTTSTQRSSGSALPKAKCFPKSQAGSGADTLIAQIKDDRTSPGEWVDPTSLNFSIGEAGKVTTPMDIGGIAKGTTAWMISMSQVKGVPWIGVNTQHPSLQEKTQGATSFALTSFSGPGRVEVFEFGPPPISSVGEIWFSGSEGSAQRSHSVDPNTHVHPNWIFTEPGHYTLGITMTTQAKDGSELKGSTTLSIDVGTEGGVNDGHFDLGPSIGAAGSTTVWVDANGNPCTPDANDLAAAGLAKTGAAGIGELETAAAALAFLGALLLVLKRRGSLRLRRQRA